MATEGNRFRSGSTERHSQTSPRKCAGNMKSLHNVISQQPDPTRERKHNPQEYYYHHPAHPAHPTHLTQRSASGNLSASASGCGSHSSYSRLPNNPNDRKNLGDPGSCSCLVCCFGCLTICGCRDWVCRKMVFFPPPAQYHVEVEHVEDEHGETANRQVMYIIEGAEEEEPHLGDPYWSPNFTVFKLPTKRSQCICSFHITRPTASNTILFSHGNATDIGLLRNHLLDLSESLNVNVYAYDYTGYGLSTNPGRPTIADVLADASAAYLHLTNNLKCDPRSIILYGQSLGTGPTLHLAKKHKVKGVVVHSGIMSALRVIRPYMEHTYWFDVFPNIDDIGHSRSPVFVIHGTHDHEIDIRHGEMLHLASGSGIPPWWVEGGGHNDIEFDHRKMYIQHLQKFICQFTRNTPIHRNTIRRNTNHHPNHDPNSNQPPYQHPNTSGGRVSPKHPNTNANQTCEEKRMDLASVSGRALGPGQREQGSGGKGGGRKNRKLGDSKPLGITLLD